MINVENECIIKVNRKYTEIIREHFRFRLLFYSIKPEIVDDEYFIYPNIENTVHYSTNKILDFPTELKNFLNDNNIDYKAENDREGFWR